MSHFAKELIWGIGWGLILSACIIIGVIRAERKNKNNRNHPM